MVFWNDLQRLTFAREGEEDAITRLDGENTDDPYFPPDEVEYLHLEVGQLTLLKISPRDHDQIGETALSSLTAIHGFTLPLNTVKIVQAKIYLNDTDGRARPAILLSAAEWFQRLDVPASVIVRYAIINGELLFAGHAIDISFIVEPSLEEFRANEPILPGAGYVEPRIDKVHHLLSMADWLPQGRG